MPINLHQVKKYIAHVLTAKRKGHSVHSPFAYQLCEEVFYNNNRFYDFEKLREVRAGLLKNNRVVQVEDLGAGSKTFKHNTRKISAIAGSGISSVKQSELLYKMVNLLQPKNIVELGTSVGLNTLYLAGAHRHADVYSIEGSFELYQFAEQLAKKQEVKNCTFIHGNFDREFPALLKKLSSLDFLYVDGNHTYEATINYFNIALANKNSQSVFVFDDIYWSEGMTRAWNEIKGHSSVTLSIDAFHLGFIFFREEMKERVELKFLI